MVKKDQVGQQRLRFAQSFLTIVGHERVVALALKVVSQYVGKGTLVFDDENARSGHDSDQLSWNDKRLLTPGLLIPPQRPLPAGGG